MVYCQYSGGVFMSNKLIVTISDELYMTVESLAKRMGVSIPEYIRFLILKEQEKMKDSEISI
jgi:hypothetical protein